MKTNISFKCIARILALLGLPDRHFTLSLVSLLIANTLLLLGFQD